MEGSTERLWLSRLRWRMRGAWMWPAFGVFTLGDALIVHSLPLSGDRTGVVPALLLAAFFNLVVVAVAAPMVGALVRRRRRPDLPKAVAHDYAGTALLPLVTLGLLAAGLAHHPAASRQEAKFGAQAMAARAYIAHQAPAVYRRNVDRADTLRLEPDLYRTCVPGPDPGRALCLFINTDQSPPGIRRDVSREPNASFARAGAYRP
jgi:hypothetical protein